jgi:hypothetical protein
MFDPTAFDNMKVVMEGALYDRDSKGDIIITDRNDLINLAKMSRRFDVSFQLPDGKSIANVKIYSTLLNLAAELFPSVQTEQQAGCFVRLEFYLEQNKELNYQDLKNIFLNIWGDSRDISLSIQYNPLEIDKNISTTITVDFGRLINEEQMDDLVEMADFMITTLQQLNK